MLFLPLKCAYAIELIPHMPPSSSLETCVDLGCVDGDLQGRHEADL